VGRQRRLPAPLVVAVDVQIDMRHASERLEGNALEPDAVARLGEHLPRARVVARGRAVGEAGKGHRTVKLQIVPRPGAADPQAEIAQAGAAIDADMPAVGRAVGMAAIGVEAGAGVAAEGAEADSVPDPRIAAEEEAADRAVEAGGVAS